MARKKQKGPHVRVWAVEVGARNALVLRWRASFEGHERKGQELIGKLTGARRADQQLRRDADRRAADKERELADELIAEAQPSDDRITWNQFRKEYREDRLKETSKSNTDLWKLAADRFESILNNAGIYWTYLEEIENKHIALFESKLIQQVSAATCNTYASTLCAGLNWAADVKEWREPVRRNKRASKATKKKAKRKMRGRPLTLEEVERYALAVPKVIKNPAYHKGFQDWIFGLYHSGLRLQESLDLWWDDPEKHVPKLTRWPEIHFAPTQKNGSVQIVATTPMFADFLKALPNRTGPVFNPMTRAGRVRNRDHASRLLAEIGAAAGIHTLPGRTATAHDLRRSFGSKWALHVMPRVLQHMMRHASLKSVEDYYLSHTAKMMGREIADAVGKMRDGHNIGHPVNHSQAAKQIARHCE